MEERCFTVKLQEDEDHLNVTQQVQNIVDDLGLGNGHIYVLVEHTTCALLLQEDEPCLMRDFHRRLNEFAAQSQRGVDKDNVHYYEHDDLDVRTVNLEEGRKERINGHAHIRASLFPQSLTLHVKEGKLRLGTWQQILFFDFDDLDEWRDRTISVSII
jgi:secondary thiamine-phosphate synthase enzyme